MLASPLGVPADLQSADKKGLDLFDADLQSASSENAASRIWRYEKPTAADCKSALKWSNLLVGIEDLKSFGKSLDS